MEVEHFFNPDGLSEDDLADAASYFRTMHDFCMRSLVGRIYRRQGQIDKALEVEKECQEIYEKLPADWQW